jgi:hypothetical protein
MPLKVRITFPEFKIDLSGYRKDIAGKMQDLWRGAIGAFVKGTMGLVHVDTGMSAASMRKAAVTARIWGDIQQQIIRLQKHPEGRAWYGRDKSGYRSMQEGIALAEKATKVIIEYPRMEFNFAIKVWQWKYWEEDWGSLVAGRQAFNEYINTNFRDMIPSLTKYIRVRRKGN